MRTTRFHTRFTVLTLAGCAAVAFAQPAIGPQQRVDPNNTTNAAVNETSMAISDWSEKVITGGWNDYRNQIKSFFTISTDGGATWNDVAVRPPAAHQSSVEGDPMTAYDHRDGTLYAGAMSFAGNGGIYVARMDPGTGVFNPSVMARISSSVDKGWMTVGVDPADPNNINKSIVYIAYNQGLSYSNDKGQTWTGPVTIDNNFGIGFLPLADPSGTMYVVWWDFGSGIWIRKSVNGGQSFLAKKKVATRMDVWGIDGTRFPGNFRVPPLSTFAINPTNGDLYVMYFDTTQISGGNRDVDLYFTKSTDGGNTWSAPVAINGGQGDPQADSFYPWVEVDKTGRIGVVFYDTRNGHLNDSNAPALIDTYFTYSEDGGNTWNEKRLTPTTWSSQFDGFGDFFIGDYLGMGAATSHAGVHYWPLYLATTGNQPHQYTNKIYFPCTGDFNADESLNTQDITDFLNAWNAGAGSADINGDGDINTLDVLAFLNAWNAGCPE